MGRQQKPLLSRTILACCLFCAGSPVLSGATALCDAASRLRQFQSAAAAGHPISDAAGIRAQVDILLAEIEASERMNAVPSLRRLQADFSALAQELAQGPDTAATPQGRSRDARLSGIVEELTQIEPVFGCNTTPVPISRTGPEHFGTGNGVTPGLPALRGLHPRSSVVGWLLASGTLLLLAAILRWRIRRQDSRKLCRTSMLIVNDDRCTVTHIVDINRTGMKVEASAAIDGDAWLDLYFCGHQTQGRIVWRNEYFAGVQFRNRISAQTLNDVILKSRKPLDESGLAGHATPCFSIGCHANCPHHRPTTLSAGKSEG